jgi:hypothetical protein
MISCASATVNWNGVRLKIVTGSDAYDMQTLYDDTVSTYGESTTNNSIFNETSDGVWQFRCFVYNEDDNPLFVNSSECSELRIGGTSIGYGIQGAFDFDNVTIVNWNNTLNTEIIDYSSNNWKTLWLQGNSTANNAIFRGFFKILGSQSSTPSVTSDIAPYSVWNNVTVEYGVQGMILCTNNATLSNFSVIHGSNDTILGQSPAGFHTSYIDDSVLSNFTIDHIGEYTGVDTDDLSGSYGFQVGGDNNVAYNINVNGTRYSGYNVGGENWTMTDISATYTHHNAMELEIEYSDIDGIYIANNTIHGLFTSSTLDEPYFNNNYSNITIYHDSNDVAIRGYHTTGMSYQNIDIYGDSVGYQGDNCSETLIKNMTYHGSGNSIVFTYISGTPNKYSTNNIVMDSDVDNIIFRSSTNNIIANVNYSSILDDLGGWDSSYYLLQPLNVRVVNATNAPVKNATLTLSVTTFGLNGLGEYFVNVSTDEYGYPVSPIYVPDYLVDSVAGYTYYNLNTVSAEKDGESVTSAAFNPDETWYSANLSDLNGTPMILVLEEYWTPTPGTHYIGVPETHTWNAITGQFDITFSGTYTEPQTEITGVEVRP